jgi:tRNA threonylcarbamoyladenosine biosynthesis protein TsaB
MLILALDTTTRAGSLALVRDGQPLEVAEGDPGQTHAARLPGAILDCLARHHLTLGDLDLYGVAVGPGSFTGLRIGIATIQGLAFAHGRLVVGVSALDALAEAAGPAPPAIGGGRALRAAWMDARRGEVYGRLYQFSGSAWQPMGPPLVNRPSDVLAGWFPSPDDTLVELVGDGAVAYRAELTAALGSRARVADTVPPLAPAIASIAAREQAAGLAVRAAAIRPLYIRRPDVELTRERHARELA